MQIAGDKLLDERLGLRLSQFDNQVGVAGLQKRQQFRQEIGRERGNDAELQFSLEQPALMAREIDEVAGGRQHLIATGTVRLTGVGVGC